MLLATNPTSQVLTSPQLSALTVFSLLIGLYGLIVRWFGPPKYRVLLPYPPGPPSTGYFSGNASQLPQSRSWKVYTEWAKEYGDIIHVTMYGEHTIILNSLEDTVELFERRSGLYSDRKQSTMTQLMGWGFNVGLKPYGTVWRHHRRTMRKYFDKRPSSAFVPVQTSKVHRLLKDLLDTPEEFARYTKRAATAIIMSILYGFNISDDNIDYFAHLSEVATGKLSESMIPGAEVVDALPFLRHVPAWVPGAQFQRYAAYVKKYADAMLEAPMRLVTEQSMQGIAGACVTADLLEDCDNTTQYNKVKDLAATLYAAGSDTLTSAFTSFFLAMLLFPDIQQKARAEIDDVTNRDRLPNFDDRPALPYIEALMRELLRWRPPLPLNVPHYTSDNDVYKGYYIPKGTVVIANIWAMSRNEQVYPNPEEFKPERFLDQEGSLKADDEFLIAFGYGRRICPGKHIALGNLYILITSVLATFDIKQQEGADVSPDLEYTDGMISHPTPFDCSVKPRDEAAANLVREC